MTGPAFDHERYLSPFTWRYGSDDMRALWSQAHKHRLWRRIWVALASAQMGAGLVTEAQVADLEAHVDDVDLARAEVHERELRHDLMAEVHTYAEQCPVGGGIIHLGATSMDVEDNADALRLRDALDLILDKLAELMSSLATRIEGYADTTTMAFTHLQPAEPTTLGYRLSQYGYDLLVDFEDLVRIRDQVKGKGFKGAVGTGASYAQLLSGQALTPAQLEAHVMGSLGLEAMPVATQTYARKQDHRIISALASLGQSLYKFAFDLRLLQSPPIGEWAEPFGKKQIGSSAMPFKRNPINAENMDSLARLLATYPRVTWDNAAHSLLERTLDDSANRRTVLPEACLITDELLKRATRLIEGLRVDEGATARLMNHYGIFAATERLLMEAVKRGGDRQVLHEVIREHALAAWADLRNTGAHRLADTLCADDRVTALLPEAEARACLEADDYVGDAPERARALAVMLTEAVASRRGA